MKLLHIFLLELLLIGCVPSPGQITATVTTAVGQTSTAVSTLTGTDTPDPGLTFTPAITTIPPEDDPVLVGAGDIAHCSSNGDEITEDILDRIEGTVFTTGDNVYPSGTAQEFANCYEPSWGRHKGRTYPSPGNHDYGSREAAGYYQYFGARAGDPAKGYYSYDLGTWHIIVVNSNLSVDAGSPQEQWLREDLAAHPVACTLAYWHHPRFSSGVVHGSNPRMQPLWQALYDFGADVILAGHEHNYERFALQNPQGVADPTRGIRQFVIGSGGRSHYSFGPPIDNSEIRNNDTYGVLKLTLHPEAYTWEFVPEAGQIFSDSGNAPCIRP